MSALNSRPPYPSRPWSEKISIFLNELLGYAGRWMVLLTSILVLGLTGGYFFHSREIQKQEARNLFYKAKSSLEDQLKELEKAINQKEFQKTQNPLDVLIQGGFDADVALKQSIELFEECQNKYSKTKSAHQARIELGNVYYWGKQYENALKWYQSAQDNATSSLEKSFALYQQAMTLENLNRCAEAIEMFKKALSGEVLTLKGEVLMGMARNHEKLKAFKAAEEVYDRVLAELGDTEYYSRAELFKQLLVSSSSSG